MYKCLLEAGPRHQGGPSLPELGNGKEVKREHFVYSQRVLLASVLLKGVSDRNLNLLKTSKKGQFCFEHGWNQGLQRNVIWNPCLPQVLRSCVHSQTGWLCLQSWSLAATGMHGFQEGLPPGKNGHCV